jgi:type I restriction enzyme S subunit
MSADKLPDGWTRVKFGDVVCNVNENSRDLEADGIDRVVGLDHLDPGSLRLLRWENLADLPDGTTFTRKFRSGQVLFGKRRAYQRKVAVPDFGGVCSGDILVFEPADKRMLAEFLPYLVQSDGFFDHALGTSAGSLSPRTKWAELAKYEFALPPVDEQERLAALLGQSDLVVRRIQDAIAGVDQLLVSLVTESYRHWREHGRMLKVPQFGELTMGRQKAPKYELGVNPVPYLRVADVGNLQLEPSNLPLMDFSVEEVAKYRLRRGDVLITEGDIVSAANVGRAAVFEDGPDPCCFQNTLIRLRPSEGVDSYFVTAMLEGARLAGVLAAAAGTTTVSHLGLKKLAGVSLPMAPPAAQSAIAGRLRSTVAFREQLRGHLDVAVAVARTTRSEVGL